MAASSSSPAVSTANYASNLVAIFQIEPIVPSARPGAAAAAIWESSLSNTGQSGFFYSLEQVRNPERCYEVYRMTGLLVSDLVGCQGKVIYGALIGSSDVVLA